VKEKKYKSGEIPELGDFVCRKHKDKAYEIYGVVIGKWKSASGDLQLPIIYWSNTGKARKSLASHITLAARNRRKYP